MRPFSPTSLSCAPNGSTFSEPQEVGFIVNAGLAAAQHPAPADRVLALLALGR